MQSRILVVDDEQLVADTLGIIFQKRGFECKVAYTGVEAVASAEIFCPELFLCDITLPDMNGLDVASSVTKKCPDCHVLLLTGYYANLRPARQWALTHNVSTRILTKPMPPEDLLREAEALLHTSSAMGFPVEFFV